MNLLSRCHLVILLLSAAILPCSGEVAAVRSLSADLSLHFICSGQDRVSIEKRVVTFLIENGFKVLNLARLQQEHQVFFLKTNIKSLDAKHRMIDLLSPSPNPDRYVLTLNTPPPTRREVKIEDAILRFVSDTLKCDVRQVTRGENGSDRRDLHEDEVGRLESLFVEAERLRGERKL